MTENWRIISRGSSLKGRSGKKSQLISDGFLFRASNLKGNGDHSIPRVQIVFILTKPINYEEI